MGTMDAVFGVIVATGLWLLGRKIRRFLREGGPCCGCSAKNCPAKTQKP
ncbi:hypothetical protein [Thermosulfurimonas dismutans]|uniref:FeoB-associated Cys-rich membrane protein n=1 Tax=Thermosulfurimonas dismutans TaxID=999894 RepID=A0A179D1Y0_9BACT|nr:hypothetical protein [Thermosulfurimonas dismutans]OAQ20067.1 hypothetical protein TDIS_1887 [Thermosulfurimonas dismutans]